MSFASTKRETISEIKISGIHILTLESYFIQMGLLLFKHNKLLATLLKDSFCSSTHGQRLLLSKEQFSVPAGISGWQHQSHPPSERSCHSLICNVHCPPLSSCPAPLWPSMAPAPGRHCQPHSECPLSLCCSLLLFSAPVKDHLKQLNHLNMAVYEPNIHSLQFFNSFNYSMSPELKCFPHKSKG